MREIVVPTFLSLSQPISQVLEQLAQAGVRLIEVHGDAPDSHIDLTNEEAVNALAEAVRRLPLRVHSVHSPFSQPSEEYWDISQPDDAKCTAALSNRAKVIRSSARLGARHVILHVGVRARGEERLARSCASLAQLAGIARESGVKLAVENLPPDHLGGSLAEMRRALDGLDPGVVGFCLDTGHAMLGADPPENYIRAFGPRMLAIHWHANDCREDQHLFPGVGPTDWDAFFTALDEVGYHLPITVEAAPPDTVCLEEALGAVRAALQGKRGLHLA